MRLAWATDIHVNMVSDEAAAALGRELARADVVLLAGDIAEAHSLERYLRLVGGRVPTYFVLGNHDFYGGSIARVRAAMRELSRAGSPVWLPAAGVVSLTRTTALVGVDGWGDGRVGDFSGSPIELSDWVLIEELRGLNRATRLERLRALGDESADVLRPLLDEALAAHSGAIVLTHVPPFRESCWHDGAISSDDWLPWFTCRAVGDVLLAAAERHPGRQIAVYCGHTHGGGVARIRDNLIVHTGAAQYGKPAVQGIVTA